MQDSPGASPPYVSEVRLAGGFEASWLTKRLTELSAPWATAIHPIAGSTRLRIPLREGKPAAAQAPPAAANEV